MVKSKLLMILIFSTLLFSCKKSNDGSVPQVSENKVLVLIREGDNDQINRVDILAFRVDPMDSTKEHFAYRVESSAIVDAQQPGTKQVTVPLLSGGKSQYRFVVLANSKAEIDALGEIAIATEKEALLRRLIATTESRSAISPAGYIAGSFPMWGESQQMLITNSTEEISSINLIRMLARIDLSVDGAITNKFKLKDIRLYNYNSKGYIVPNTDPTHWDGQFALLPTIPNPDGSTLGPIVYDNLSQPNVLSTKQIYLFEKQGVALDKASSAVCLVIGGEYDNSGVVSYYRLDLVDRDQNQAISAYWNILRNHFYNIRLTAIGGPGQPTPEEAFNSQEVVLTASITVWEQGGLPDIEINGDALFQVSKSEFTLPMNQRTALNSDNKLTVFTDYRDGWAIEKIVDENGDFIPASWLTVSGYVGSANTKTTISLLADENSSGLDRVAFIYILSGRVSYIIKVTQTTMPELGIVITNAAGKEINNLMFSSNVGGTVPSQLFNVSWVPRDRNSSVTSTALAGITAFNYGTGNVVTPGVVTGVDGLKSYTIQPPAMTAAEVLAEPFKEKATRLDFTVTNGISYESKVLFLQQRNFNVVPTVTTDYLMNGSKYFFTLKANASWAMEVFSDSNHIIKSLNTTSGGQFEDQRVENIYFDIINNLDLTLFDATVTFRIWSTNPDHYFPDKYVTIKGYSIVPNRRLLTIGSGANDFGYNFAGTAASNKLITTARNFGTLSNSYIKSNGFTIINGSINPTEAQMLNWLITNPVSMVVLGYDYYNITPTVANYFLQYLNSGGVVLAFTDRTDATVSGNLLTTILGAGTTLYYATGAGSVYPFANLDNALLNGPFGDIRNRQWGEDASTTVRITGFNTANVDVLSSDRDLSVLGSTATAGYATAIKHKTLNFIWVGDGGFNSNNAAADLIICPFKLDAAFFPIPKASYGNGTIFYPVYNSVFTANAIAWGMKRTRK